MFNNMIVPNSVSPGLTLCPSEKLCKRLLLHKVCFLKPAFKGTIAYSQNYP